MDDASQIADTLHAKKAHGGDGAAVGKAMLPAECGRVMAVTDITEPMISCSCWISGASTAATRRRRSAIAADLAGMRRETVRASAP